MFFTFNIGEPSVLLPLDPLSSSQPTQSEIVSITGALIVTSFLAACVLLTHLLNAIEELRAKISLADIVHRTLNVNVSLRNLCAIIASFVSREVRNVLNSVKCIFYAVVLRNQKKKYLWITSCVIFLLNFGRNLLENWKIAKMFLVWKLQWHYYLPSRSDVCSNRSIFSQQANESWYLRELHSQLLSLEHHSKT